MKAARTTKTTRTAKTKRNSPVSHRGRGTPEAIGRCLSIRPQKDDMPKQVKQAPEPAPGQRVRESVDRVMAECDKVDAALFEMTRATQVEDLPPLTIEEIDAGDGEGGTKRGWAVVSADPERPLTETQAKEIIAVMSRGTPAPIGIAAE
jgi:hypothetical protein